MREINLEEMKKIEINMLKYIDSICRKNNIKYSLIGGSLIGAVRHGGMIPWDDDIDIILNQENYKKLLYILLNEKNPKYKCIYYTKYKKSYYPFIKIVDTRTIMKENNLKYIDDYGVFIDIFEYNNIPNGKKGQDKFYKRQKRYRNLMSSYSYEPNKSKKSLKQIFKIILKPYTNMIGIYKIVDKYNKEQEKYKNTNYIMSNWVSYSEEREIQESKNFNEFIDINFDGIKAMITKNYDEILKTTFGDYMKLPPKEKQVTHHNYKVFLKDEKYEGD